MQNRGKGPREVSFLAPECAGHAEIRRRLLRRKLRREVKAFESAGAVTPLQGSIPLGEESARHVLGAEDSLSSDHVPHEVHLSAGGRHVIFFQKSPPSLPKVRQDLLDVDGIAHAPLLPLRFGAREGAA